MAEQEKISRVVVEDPHGNTIVDREISTVERETVIAEHDADSNAHPYIRGLVAGAEQHSTEKVDAHNQSVQAHPYIQELVADAQSEAGSKIEQIYVGDESVVQTDQQGKKFVQFQKDQFGKVDGIKVNNVEQSIDAQGKVNIPVPTRVAELSDSNDYATKNDAQAMVDAAKVESASLEYEENEGEPNASVEYNEGDLHFTLQNMKMKFSELTEEEKAEIKGRKGEQGDSAIWDENEPHEKLTDIANSLGQSTVKPISQKAVTDAIGSVTDLTNKKVGSKKITLSRTKDQINGWSTENIGLVKGKKYRVRSYVDRLHEATVSFYLRDHSAAQNPVSFNAGVNILAGEYLSDEIIYECVDDTAQYLSVYSDQKQAAEFGVIYEELGATETASDADVADGMYTDEIFMMEQGGINGGLPYDTTKRIRTIDKRFKIDGVYYVETNEGYHSIAAYFDEQGQYIGTSNNDSWRAGKWKDEWHGFIAISVRAHDNSDITPNDNAGLRLHRNIRQTVEPLAQLGEEYYGNVGVSGGDMVSKQTATFEQGAIDTGADVSANNCMRTPLANPIRVGVGTIKCVFNVPKPKSNSPWSKPYFYKDGVIVDYSQPNLQINNGTVWEFECDGSFNEVRFRVYVSSVASADISASSVDCTFLSNGSRMMGELSNLKDGITTRYLHLGKLIQSSVGETGALNDDDANYVCMADVLQLPYNNARIAVKTTKDISVCISLGSNGESMAKHAWMRNGYILNTPTDKNYYQIIFGRVDTAGTPTAELTLEEVKGLVASGKICVIYNVAGNDNILQSRPDAEIVTRAMKMAGHLLVCHTSDQHGNVYGLRNAYKFADYVGADVLVNTGDTCSQAPSNGYAYAKDLADNYGIPTLVCPGNHDGYHLDSEEDIRELFLDNFITDGYQIPDDKTYYYYDIAAKNIRFIMLNTSQTGYSVYNGYGCIMQDQVDFFVDALASTPSGYGVIVGFHIPLARKNWMEQNDYGFFNSMPTSIWEYDNVFAQGILDIVDAYIGRTSFDVTWQNIDDGKMNEGSGAIVSKTGNFANAQGEFICYMTGHTHQDRVAFFANTAHKQLCLNVTCTASCNFQTESYDDLPRKGDGVCANALNIYAVDMTAKQITIIRVGSDFNMNGIPRKTVTIKYVDD